MIFTFQILVTLAWVLLYLHFHTHEMNGMKTSLVIPVFTLHNKIEAVSISMAGIFDASEDAAVIFLDSSDDHRISVNLQATSESSVC